MNPIARSRRGASALELAFALPMLLAIMLGAIDLGRYVADAQRAAGAAAAVADLAGQTEKFTNEPDPDKIMTGQELGVLNAAAREVARPLALFADGAVIVTVLSNPDGRGTRLEWTSRWGRSDIKSGISPESTKGVTILQGEAAVYAEVGFRFRPFLLSGGLLGLDRTYEYRTFSVRRPRLTGPVLVPKQ